MASTPAKRSDDPVGPSRAKAATASTSSPAKQMTESERRKMAAIGGDMFAGARDRRVVTGPVAPSPSSLPSSPAPVAMPAATISRVPATPPASSSSSTISASSISSPAVSDDITAAGSSTPSASNLNRMASVDIRQQSLESKLASDMEHARERAVHLAHTWLSERQSKPLSADIQASLVDDWLSYGSIPGEKLVMRIEPVQFCRTDMAYNGTLVMTSYQLYFEPLRPEPKLTSGHPLGGGKLAIPLSTIERIEMEKAEVVRRKGDATITHMIDLTCKDMRTLRFGFASQEMCKRAHTCLDLYVFPNKEDYLFAFNYRVDRPFPPEIDGWKIYDMDREYKRMGLPSRSFRFSDINKEYKLCNSYPTTLCVPSTITDADLQAVGAFRSRRRIPALSWCHPNGQASIWRCSQPRVGMNMARSPEDEKLLLAITDLNANNKNLQIFDCRPKINAVGNKFAGKGYEITDFYKNATVRFMNIENIHVMRDSYQKLTKACLRNAHDITYINSVAAAGWLTHISGLLQSTHTMVGAVDREKSSILSHCSDGWDRTTQLVSLTALCLDPYYRTIEGFFVMVEKDWLSFGHKFHQRTGHRDKNYADDQRAPIFLQWCDAVYQLTEQFPRHFQFNSHLLVTMMNHLYSCRFGTFFFNSDRKRKKFSVAQRTVSIWTYLLGSPAAHAGEFINPFYVGNGSGVDDFTGVPSMVPSYDGTDAVYNDPTLNNGTTNNVNEDTPPIVSTSSASVAIPGAAARSRATTTASMLSPSPPTSSPPPPLSSVPSSPFIDDTKQIDRSQSVSSSPSGTGAAALAAAATATLFAGNANVGRGAVLYPNWSMKKLTLWADYFLRWTTDDGAFGTMGNGSVAPYGSTSAPFSSNQAVVHRYVHRVITDTHQIMNELNRSRSRITDLEVEVRALRAAAAATPTAAAATAATVSAATIAAASSASSSSTTAVADANAAVAVAPPVASVTSAQQQQRVRDEEHYEMMLLSADGTAISSSSSSVPRVAAAHSRTGSDVTPPVVVAIDSTTTTTTAPPTDTPAATIPASNSEATTAGAAIPGAEVSIDASASAVAPAAAAAAPSSRVTSSLLSSLLGDDPTAGSHEALLGTVPVARSAASLSSMFDDAPVAPSSTLLPSGSPTAAAGKPSINSLLPTLLW